MLSAIKMEDYRKLAKEKLPENIFDFIDCGACDEITKQNNSKAFNNIHLRPLCLRDVSHVDTSIEILKQHLDFPLLIAPTAFHQLVDQEGEISTSKAAKTCNIPMIVSSMSNKSLEDIALHSANSHLWLQTYIFKKRDLTKQLIERAEKAGYTAVVITIGVPISGKRDRDIRNQFSLPPELSTGNFNSTANSEVIYNFTAGELDSSITWDDIQWVQSMTHLPIILKGIINQLDAEKACQLKVSGIIVSNHGGRQLDTTEATISVLPDIVNTVAGRTMILLDGGIQRGTDIFKSIAFGADAILIGRPILWALAVAGEAGVVAILNMLKNEFDMTMKLAGCAHISEIKSFSKHMIKVY